MMTAAGEHREVLEGGRLEPEGGLRRQSGDHGLIVAVVAAVIGGAIGGLAVRAWDQRPSPVSFPQRSAELSDLRFSLGAQTGGLASSDGGKPVLSLSVVVANDGKEPTMVTAIRVSGPGAAFVASPAGGPSTDLPQAVDPGHSVKVRFGISSDCSVPVRPLPHVAFVVSDVAKGTRTVPADIPDLDALWGLTLLTPTCGTT